MSSLVSSKEYKIRHQLYFVSFKFLTRNKLSELGLNQDLEILDFSEICHYQ